LRVPALLDDEVQRRFGRIHDLAGFHQLEEFGIRDRFGLHEIVSAEKERPADQREGNGEQNQPAPVHLRIISPARAIAVVLWRLRIFF